MDNVAITPLPAVISGTSSKVYLDEKASSNFLFKVVIAPEFVQIGTDGLLTINAKNAGSWPIEVKVYSKNCAENQGRQYILKVVEKVSEEKIWAYNSGNYYERNTAVKPFRVVAGDAPANVKVGMTINY
jgi:hypothetical protein